MNHSGAARTVSLRILVSMKSTDRLAGEATGMLADVPARLASAAARAVRGGRRLGEGAATALLTAVIFVSFGLADDRLTRAGHGNPVHAEIAAAVLPGAADGVCDRNGSIVTRPGFAANCRIGAGYRILHLRDGSRVIFVRRGETGSQIEVATVSATGRVTPAQGAGPRALAVSLAAVSGLVTERTLLEMADGLQGGPPPRSGSILRALSRAG